MPTAFGSLEERLVGAAFFFVPDGTNIGSVEAPQLTSAVIKPADQAEYEDYNLGSINQSAYDPVNEERTREAFRYARKKYVRDTKNWVVADAYNITLIEYPATLFDELNFGLVDPIVDGTPQPIFANNVREKKGWVKIRRYLEGGELFMEAEFHGKITIQENPPDSFEPGSPVLRLEHLGDAASSLEEITFNPTP